MTEEGELFTWSKYGDEFNLGHEVNTPQATPKRVEALVGVRAAAVAICGSHTIVAVEDGVVWAFGRRRALGLGASIWNGFNQLMTPTPIPDLRVRALRSP